MIEKWECKDQRTRHVLSVTVACTYLQAFFYDFGSYRDKMQRNKVTIALTYENAHVSIFVGLGDTPVQEPTHIWDAKTKELK